MKKFIVTILCMFSIFNCKGQIAKYGNDFLNIGNSAREMALGRCAVASCYGAEAGFWNPSLMFASDYKSDISAMHCFYFGELANYDFLSACHQTDSLMSLGFSFIRLGIDDIQNTIYLFDYDGNMNFSNISYFSVADYALYFSIGKKFANIPNLSVGANVKLIFRHQGNFANAYGFGIDLASSYKINNFSFGLVLRDITTTFDIWNINKSKFDSVYVSTGNSIPENSIEQTAPSVLFSIAYKYNWNNFQFLAEIGSQITFDGKRNYLISSNFANLNPSAGLEISYRDFVYFRMGITDFMKNNNVYISKSYSYVPSLGIGIKFNRFSFDYCFMDASKNSYDYRTNVFSLGVKF
ncbi:MAG: hypothetical protein MJ211_10500 [Bacteroidales bacterium]|nr:hypothetical protein [Bacteroidales bacterium]